MLVLLVIFMVTAPLVNPGVIDLPSVGKSAVPPAAPLEVIVRRDQSLMLRERDKGRADERAVSSAQLVAALQERQKKSPDQPVVISADKDVRYEAVLKVMDELQRHNIRPGRAAGEARDTMSYAIPADEPGGAAPAALSLLVHGVLFALLVFSLHWQSKHPDPVVAELWTECRRSSRPRPRSSPSPKSSRSPNPSPRSNRRRRSPTSRSSGKRRRRRRSRRSSSM